MISSRRWLFGVKPAASSCTERLGSITQGGLTRMGIIIPQIPSHPLRSLLVRHKGKIAHSV